MSIDTIRTEPIENESPTPARQILEVSDVDAEEVAAYARTVDDPEVYLERKGGRTYLVAG